MQVGRYHGRHYLRDGYHRAFGLLSRGITDRCPRSSGTSSVFEELVPDPRTMLPQDGYLGDRPTRSWPTTSTTRSSAAVQLPAVRKMVIVQALELTPVG